MSGFYPYYKGINLICFLACFSILYSLLIYFNVVPALPVGFVLQLLMALVIPINFLHVPSSRLNIFASAYSGESVHPFRAFRPPIPEYSVQGNWNWSTLVLPYVSDFLFLVKFLVLFNIKTAVAYLYNLSF